VVKMAKRKQIKKKVKMKLAKKGGRSPNKKSKESKVKKIMQLAKKGKKPKKKKR